MPYYETVVVVDPLAEEGTTAKQLARVKELIESRGGTILKVEEWGKRRLAYSIKHRKEGWYFLVEFMVDGEMVGVLDEYYRLQESVLRYLTVTRDAPSPEGYVSPVARDHVHVDLSEGGSDLEEGQRSDSGLESAERGADSAEGTTDALRP